ncbi:MAG: 4,5-DOPA dioxygenase extradiol [Ferrovum sp.]|nr:4,5-DOPA dioxygenase extradiol [Ferrovum sp.]
MKTTMPTLFVGHGNPMHAILPSRYTEAWRSLGQTLPRPEAILVVSAHWFLPEMAVTAMAQPRTIHDFGGFPRALYQVQYPAPGNPLLAQRVAALLAPVPVRQDHEWGLDHGAWSVLKHLYPGANIPVVQLSLDSRGDGKFHHDLAHRLAPLRDEGVLILGSGNIVHHLGELLWETEATPYDWAVRFDQKTRLAIAAGNHEALVALDALDADGRRAVPTPEHYLPLLYLLGLQRSDEQVSFPVSCIDLGSISMTCVLIG